jgi:hypothetical protein
MHGINYRRPSRLAEWCSALVRLFRRPKGMHNAPRGGDLFPSGPQEVYEPDLFGRMGGDPRPYPREPYRHDPFAHMALTPPPPQRRYPRGAYPYAAAPNAQTMVDMRALDAGRPYLNPVLKGGER